MLIILSASSCQRESLVPTDLSEEPIIEVGAASGDKQENKVYYNYLTGEVSGVDVAALHPVSFFLDSEADIRGAASAPILIEMANTRESSTKLAVITNDSSSNLSIGHIGKATNALYSVSGAFGATPVYCDTEDILEGGLHSFDAMHTTASVFFREGADGNRLMSSPTLAMSAVSTPSESVAMPYSICDSVSHVNPTAGNYISIPYCDTLTVNLSYDRQSGLYRRMHNGKLYNDASGSELTHKNVIILIANTTTVATAEGTYLSLDVKSGGEGYYMHDGVATRLLWSRDGSALAITNEDGSPLAVVKGNTYIGFLQISRRASLIIGN